ncbi:Rieske 2Fe-2S domain-containing protein [Dactylosporangium sp. NPDC051541]|uniref:Rieske 2Fe-2S domain-containing protein n=1 Tax=Dactylosporangium sp. NPDC051541 TaxID=3363977 RepID=UPI0037A2DD96
MRTLLARLEAARPLDRFADALRRVAQATAGRGRLGDLLHGRPIGHPLHPAAVQFPVGAWMSTAVLDALPGRDTPGSRRAAAALLTAGTAAALPAAATGLADYVTLTPQQRRVALVHVTANVSALGFFAASIAARARGDHARGRLLSFTGLSLAGAGAYLGGHLAFAQGAGANHAAAALPLVPSGWHRLDAVSAIAEGKLSSYTVGEVPILVYREHGDFSALIGRCAHQAGPLAEGRPLEQGGEACVECPWHGSIFRLSDGRALRGPAASDQTALRTRVRDGHLEVAQP